MHENSLAANASNRYDSRIAAIISEVTRGGDGTDSEIAERLGFGHRQFVAPRITKLIELGVMVQSGNRRDAKTGKNVRVVGLAVRCYTPPIAPPLPDDLFADLEPGRRALEDFLR